LRFEHSVFVHGVYVYETLNPGSIIAIWAGDCKGKDKFYQNFILTPFSSNILHHHFYLPEVDIQVQNGQEVLGSQVSFILDMRLAC
jgi:hypothetical protein